MEGEPTEEDVDAFVMENRRKLSSEAEEIFRKMSKEDQRAVIKEGTLSNCRDAIGILKSRAWNACLQAHRDWMEAHRDCSIDDLVDAFVAKSSPWVSAEAEEILKSLDFETAWKVIDFGSMHGCRDPVAIIRKRLQDAKAGKAGKGARGWGSREGREGKGKGTEKRKVWKREGGREADRIAKGISKEQLHFNGQEDAHQRALYEERSVYCMGLPPLWTSTQVGDFFGQQGDVEDVYLGKLQPNATRVVSIDFTTTEGAKNAAILYDRVEIQEEGKTFVLACSIRYKVQGTPGSRFSFPGRAPGQGDPKQAQAEGRSIFLCGIPLTTSEEEIKELVEDYGEVEGVHCLPSKGLHIASFVTMVSPGEAAFAIRGLNNSKAFGSILSASYPIEKNLKRKKPHPEEEQIQWYPLELRNFPHWTVCDDIKTIILSLGPGPKRVRVIHYDPEPSLSIARAYFQEEEERDAIQKALAGYEISPGYVLKLSALPRTAGNGPGFSQTPLNQQGLHGVSGAPTGSRPSVEEMLASTEPLKLPEWSGVSSNESHESPVLGADGWPSADWNAWNSWSNWNESSTSTWLPAAFVQR